MASKNWRFGAVVGWFCTKETFAHSKTKCKSQGEYLFENKCWVHFHGHLSLPYIRLFPPKKEREEKKKKPSLLEEKRKEEKFGERREQEKKKEKAWSRL